MEVHYSSNDVEWYTPKTFFNRLNGTYNFTLDPCATKESALCKKYYTKEDNGLQYSWDKERVFMNPPYGKGIAKWVEKAYSETLNTHFDSKRAELVVGLLPARTDTKWFHRYIYRIKHATIIFLEGRLRFWRLNEFGYLEEGDACPFPNMIVVWKDD